MNVLWVNPSFLDYRVAVYKELSDLLDGQLTVIYSKSRVPRRVIDKVEAALGPRAIGMSGERQFVVGNQSRMQWANSIVNLPFQPGLLTAIRSIPADVVVAEGFFQWTPAALVKCITQRVPLVIAYEKTHHTERNCPWWRTAYRKLVLRYVDAMLCNGRECVEYSRGLGMPIERMTTGHMVADITGIQRDTAAITPAERQALREQLKVNGLCYLSVGQLIDRKGIDFMLEAWTLFEREFPNAGTLVIVGDGFKKQALMDLAAERNLKNVRFTGFVDYDRLVPYYTCADVFVMSSREDNWALVVPEAMACGLPALCSKYSGCSADLVQEGVNGWIFDPYQVVETFGRLKHCLEIRDELPRMGEAARQTVKNHTPLDAARSVVDGCRIALDHRRRNKSK